MKKNLLTTSAPNLALLILRIGIGVMFMIHGIPKLMGGIPVWEFLGSQMSILGIGFGFTFWGFMAAFSESIGGLLLIFGFFTRPAAMLMLFTMFMAALMHFTNGDGLKGASHALEMGIVFISIIISGAGKYSLDKLISKSKK